MPVITQEIPFENVWHNRKIQPGPQGIVGNVLSTIQLKNSTPTMPIRVDKSTSGNNLSRFGSNVQDGYVSSYTTGGHAGKVKDAKWYGNRGFKTAIGSVYNDMRTPDRFVEPYLSAMPQYTWRSNVATVYGVLEKNPLFLNVPGPYGPRPGDIPRNGSSPRVTAIIQEAGPVMDEVPTYRERTSPYTRNGRARWGPDYYKRSTLGK